MLLYAGRTGHPWSASPVSRIHPRTSTSTNHSRISWRRRITLRIVQGIWVGEEVLLPQVRRQHLKPILCFQVCQPLFRPGDHAKIFGTRLRERLSSLGDRPAKIGCLLLVLGQLTQKAQSVCFAFLAFLSSSRLSAMCLRRRSSASRSSRRAFSKARWNRMPSAIGSSMDSKL